MPFRLELYRGRAEPIATTVTVSGSRDNGVSSSVTTTFELDGCVVEYSGVVPFRPGDDVVVAGRRDRRGVLKAAAIRLPRQNVMLGSPTGYWVGGGMLLVVGCALLLFNVPALYASIAAGSDFGEHAVPVGFGVVLSLVGAAFTWSGMIVGHARAMILRLR